MDSSTQTDDLCSFMTSSHDNTASRAIAMNQMIVTAFKYSTKPKLMNLGDEVYMQQTIQLHKQIAETWRSIDYVTVIVCMVCRFDEDDILPLLSVMADNEKKFPVITDLFPLVNGTRICTASRYHKYHDLPNSYTVFYDLMLLVYSCNSSRKRMFHNDDTIVKLMSKQFDVTPELAEYANRSCDFFTHDLVCAMSIHPVITNIN